MDKPTSIAERRLGLSARGRATSMVFAPKETPSIVSDLRPAPIELDPHDLADRAQLTLTRWPTHYLPGAAEPSDRLVLPETLDVLVVIDLCTLPYNDMMHMALRSLMGLSDAVGDFRSHIIILLPLEWLSAERQHRVYSLVTDERPPHIMFRGVVGTRSRDSSVDADLMAVHYAHALHTVLADVANERRRPYTQTFLALQARTLYDADGTMHDDAAPLIEAILAPLINKTATHLCDAFSVHILAMQLQLTEEDGRTAPRMVPRPLVKRRAVPAADASPRTARRPSRASAVEPSNTRYYDLGRRRAISQRTPALGGSTRVVDRRGAASGAGVGAVEHFDDL